MDKVLKIMNQTLISHLRFLPLLVLSLLIMQACKERNEKQIIDQSYLDSQAYREFEGEAKKEQSFRSDEETAFERVLSNLLIHPDTKELELPVRIDSAAINSYTNSSTRFELTRSMINEPTELDYAYYPVGKTRRNAMQILFFVIEERSIYDEKELAVATFNDSSLIDVQSLAEFVNTLSLNVQSMVQIDPALNIVSEINRRPEYPVPQEYTITYRYTIGNSGKIEEKLLSKENASR